MVKTDEQRIITLLNYLVSHNRDHSQELRELAEQVKGLTGSTSNLTYPQGLGLGAENWGAITRTPIRAVKD